LTEAADGGAWRELPVYLAPSLRFASPCVFWPGNFKSRAAKPKSQAQRHPVNNGAANADEGQRSAPELSELLVPNIIGVLSEADHARQGYV
jgi:hypothetical protein